MSSYQTVDSFPSITSRLGIPQQMLCLLKELKQLLLNGLEITSSSSGNIMTADPFETELVEVASGLATLTIPESADMCIISVKGDGGTRLMFTTTIDSDNNFEFIKDEVFQLENIQEMTKANFKSTSTNKLMVTYYRYLTI